MNYTYLIFLFIFNIFPTFNKDNSVLSKERYREVTVYASTEGGTVFMDSSSGIKIQIKAAFLLKTTPPKIEYLERVTPATIRIRPDFSYGFITKEDTAGVLMAFVRGDNKEKGGFGMQADAIFINNSGNSLKDLKITGHNSLPSADSLVSDKTSLTDRTMAKRINILGSDGELSGMINKYKVNIPFQAAFFYKTDPPSILFMEGQTPCDLNIEQDFHYAFFCTSSDSHYVMACMGDSSEKPRTCSEGKRVFINNSDKNKYMSGSSH